MQKKSNVFKGSMTAFLLLVVVSVYRQINIYTEFYSPIYPAVVFTVYLVLLFGWGISIKRRIEQKNMQFFLLSECMVMVLWMTVRFIQEGFLDKNMYAMRVSGYLISIPLVLLPLFGLYAALGLGRSDDYRINSKWYLLLIPACIEIVLMLTNKKHHIVFCQMENETQVNLYFHPYIGFWIILIWAVSLEIARIVLIYRRSRELRERPYRKLLPFMVAVFMLVFSGPYISRSFVVKYEIIEYTAVMFFLEAMVWESCIMLKMVPVNTGYEEIFDRSTVAMQILMEDGETYMKSACATEVIPEMFQLLKEKKKILTPEGQEIHLNNIRGGYVIWQNDVSQLTEIMEELRASTKELEYEGNLMARELKTQSEKIAIKEKNQIYDRLTEEVGDKLVMLQELLDKCETAEKPEDLFRKICLIGTYIKRRCNLRLIELSGEEITTEEIELVWRDLTESLKFMGVEKETVWKLAEHPELGTVISVLDRFEELLEQEE